jgi:hypothetical protein
VSFGGRDDDDTADDKTFNTTVYIKEFLGAFIDNFLRSMLLIAVKLYSSPKRITIDYPGCHVSTI